MADQTDALPVGVVTLLLGDVEGSTRMWENQPDEMRAATVDLNLVVAEAVAKFDGVRPIEQGEGDSFVAAFSGASDAVACSLAVQLQLLDHALRLRMGVHTGEVLVLEKNQYAGITINRAARLRDLAHGGQVVVSSVTRELVIDSLPTDTELISLGRHRLKDLTRAEEVFQVVHPGLVRAFPPLRSLDAPADNLPAQLTSFLGRESELREVSELLSATRLLTLTGAGGCGKTRLALQVAADQTNRYSGGVWYCPLAALPEGSGVEPAVAAALTVREEQGSTLLESIIRRLRDLEVLVILDNCEHVLQGVAELVDATLRAASRLTVLATSRALLGVDGEMSWRVPSLSLRSRVPASASTASPSTASPSDAVDLFVDRAKQARPNFVMTPKDASAVEEICHRLDGIPLAIELAAARTRAMSPEQIATALADSFRLLAGGSRTSLPRQQTLHASVAWSYDLLSEKERRLLGRLSVFVGSFSSDAAAAVCAGSGLESHGVLDLLLRLVDQSLVTVVEARAAPRYRLLETTRQFARERLDDNDETAALQVRHLEYQTAAAAAVIALRSADRNAWYDEVDERHDDIVAAIKFALSTSRVDAALEVAAPMFLYWILRGRYSEGRAILDEVLAGSSGADAGRRAWVLWGAGVLGWHLSDFSYQFTRLVEALPAAQQSGDLRVQAGCLAMFALAKLQGGQDTEAVADAVEAVRQARLCGDDWVLATTLFIEAQVRMSDRRDLASAEARAVDSITVARQSGFPEWYATINLGFILVSQGRFDEADDLLEAGMDLAAERRDWAWWGLGLWGRCSVAGLRGIRRVDLEELADILERHVNATGVQALEVSLLRCRCLLADARRDFVEAERAASAAIELVSARFPPVDFFMTLVAARVAQGKTEQARAALRDFPDVSDVQGLAVKAVLEYYSGALEPADVEPLLLSALAEPYTLIGTAQNCLEAIGEIWCTSGNAEGGLRVLAAANASRLSMRSTRRPYQQERVDAAVARACKELGDAADAVVDQGSQMSLDEAAAYAVRGRGRRGRPTSGWNSLTPTEDQVVALVVEGLSNASIAERMFISRRTVGTHLSHIFTKLGVSSRAGLAGEAAKRDR